MIKFEDLVKAHEAEPVFGSTLRNSLLAPPPQTSIPTKRLDVSKAMADIQANVRWHDNTLRMVARLVHEGLTDEEILAKAGEFQCEGYSLEQTINEIQVMIDGARRKGFDQKATSATEEANVISPSNRKPFLRRLSDIPL